MSWLPFDESGGATAAARRTTRARASEHPSLHPASCPRRRSDRSSRPARRSRTAKTIPGGSAGRENLLVALLTGENSINVEFNGPDFVLCLRSFRTENVSDDSNCLSSRPSSLPRRRIAEFNRQAIAPRGSCKPKAPLRRSKLRAAAWGNRDDARLRARTARGVRFCSRGRARREWSLAPRVE